MISVVMKEKKIIITGHAGFAAYGKDIVCAACSSIVIASVNDMMTVNQKSVFYEDKGNELTIEILNDDELVLKLFNNLRELLNGLAEDYPQNIKIGK